MKDVMDLSIPQLEYILNGCKKNNDDMQAEANGETTLTGAAAIQYLMNSGEAKAQ